MLFEHLQAQVLIDYFKLFCGAMCISACNIFIREYIGLGSQLIYALIAIICHNSHCLWLVVNFKVVLFNIMKRLKFKLLPWLLVIWKKNHMVKKLKTRLPYQIMQCSAILTPFIEANCRNLHLGVNIQFLTS